MQCIEWKGNGTEMNVLKWAEEGTALKALVSLKV